MDNEANVLKLHERLQARGVSRRDFMKLCGAVAVAAGLSELAAPRIEQAFADVIGRTEGGLYPVIWMEGASCTGCTESLAQSVTPDVASVVLELLSLNYSEPLSAGAGWHVEQAKEETVNAGNFILVYEGAVLREWDGQALRIANETGAEQLAHVAAKANAVVAFGSCAVNGGWIAAHPAPSKPMGVMQFLAEKGIKTPVVNIPGCPGNPEWLTAVLVDVLLVSGLEGLKLDAQNKPLGMFDQSVHANCERRGHFEAGEFVFEFGSKEEALGYCLYPLGCRGPQTKANCGVVLWNDRRSWCVKAGAPCIGCCEANPMNPNDNWVEANTPFYKRHRDLRIGDWVVQPTAIALGLTGLLAGALVIHGFGMKISGRMDGGADFEKSRKWDEKHPDKAIGDYSAAYQPASEEPESKEGGKA